jgi:tetratricopeptide (TPR) repeat protein
MKPTRRMQLLVPALVLATALGVAHAQDAGTEGNLAFGIGARGIALAGANSARLDDASAVFWNPAALATWERGHADFMHAPIGFGDAALTAFAAAYPTLRAGSFGIGLTHVGAGGIESTDATGRPLGSIDFSETSLHATWAHRPRLPHCGNRLGIGAGVKTLTQSLGAYSATGAGLDLGLVVAAHRDVSVAWVWRDAIAPSVRLDEAADRVPATMQFAASYRSQPRRDLGLIVHAAMDRQQHLGWSPRFGVECTLRQRLHVRFGASRHGAAFGLGLGWRDYALDYAMLARSRAATQPVSLGAAWGRDRTARAEAQAAARVRAREATIRAAMTARVDEHAVAAQSAFDRGDFATALDEWKLAGGLDPQDERVARGLEASGERLAAQQAAHLADATARAARKAQFEIGLRAYTNNDYARARDVWRELAAQDSTDTEVRRSLHKTEQRLRELARRTAEEAGRLERRGEYVAALEAWQRVHEASPQHPTAAAALERCRLALEGAAERRQAAAPRRADPEAGDTYTAALQSFARGDATRAASQLRDVLRTDPEHRAAAELLARVERRTQPLSATDKTRIRELYLAGLGHFTANEFERAITEWSKILALDPGNASVAQNIDEARARLQALQEPAARAGGAP